jgi:Uma2 family endonuclease
MASTRDMLHPARSGMTYPEFLRTYPEGGHLEWVNGRAVELSSVSLLHQDVVGFLSCLLMMFAEEHDLGRVWRRPFQMKLPAGGPSRAPDLMFVADDRLGSLRKYFLRAPADLVVEVAEGDSRGLDRGEKYFDYVAGGVQEYWLIDLDSHRAEFYTTARDGRYDFMPIDDGIFRSQVLKGLWLRVDWLWQRPLPRLKTVLKEWGLL